MEFKKCKNGRINLKAIAKMVGISQPYISQLLTGKRNPSWTTAKRLSKVTGIKESLWMESKKQYQLIRMMIEEHAE